MRLDLNHQVTMFQLLVVAILLHASHLLGSPNEVPLEDSLAQWIQQQNMTVDLPAFASLTASNLVDNAVDLKIQLTSSNGEARKSKLKKMFAPILILLIIKAITLIPLALGLLGLKTWNAIQLSFVTFVFSLGFAVYEMCKKLTVHQHPFV